MPLALPHDNDQELSDLVWAEALEVTGLSRDHLAVQFQRVQNPSAESKEPITCMKFSKIAIHCNFSLPLPSAKKSAGPKLEKGPRA